MSDAFQLLQGLLISELGGQNVHVDANQGFIRVNKPAGQKSVQGAFWFQASDTHMSGGETLVNMKRAKVRIQIRTRLDLR